MPRKARAPEQWRNSILRYADEAPESLLANPQNWRMHPREQTAALQGSLTELGWIAPVIVNETTQHVIDGHARIGEAIARGEPTVPVAYVNLSEDQERLALATFDPIAAMAGTDQKMLDDLLAGLSTNEDGLSDLLASLASEQTEQEHRESRPTLSDRFLVPPFSVLDARQGYWQDRKAEWLSLGIQSEFGRGDLLTCPGEQVTESGLNYYRARHPKDNGLLGETEQARSHYAVPSGSLRDAASLGTDGRTVRGDGRGRAYKSREWVKEMGLSGLAQAQSGTSIFDPVLTELAYRWFCPASGNILDPFAGGSVRGIIASKLGRKYTGIDLRPEQIEANKQQLSICDSEPYPSWLVGDAKDADTLAPGLYDFLFTSPPYADLERYSDDPADLSTMDYPKFLAAYRQIIATCVGMLVQDRFACFVVGDIRDKKGIYRNLIGETVSAFADAGASLYNEAILVMMVGSLPIRVAGMFSSSRKLGKTHQNVLVFVKGDPRKATEACGEVVVALPEDEAQRG